MTKRQDLYISLLLLLLTALVYWPVTQHEFINYDDHLYVTDNPVVQEGLTLEGVQWAFRSCQASNWHPITWLSHMLDCSLFYLYPGGHHLTNLLFHLANTVLLFQFLQRLTGARWRCAFVAALFAWHPLHVESVAWVAERKDVLSTFFLILSLWAYVRYTEQPGARRYLLVLGLFALGLMSKPMLVTLPCLLLLLDYWPLGRLRALIPLSPRPLPPGLETCPASRRAIHSAGFLLMEKTPFFVLSFLSCLVTLWAQHKSGALKSLEAVPFVSRSLNAIISYAGYLWKMVWPADLAVFYPLTERSLSALIASTLVLAAISFIVWRCRRQHPYLLVGWLWYLGVLVPVIGLVQVGGQSMADRYTYIPLIGLFIMISWGLAEWGSRAPSRRRLLVPACAAALLGCLRVTSLGVDDWQNSRTLFEHALSVTENNFVAHNNLGVALKSEGKISEAIAHYREAVRINPGDSRAHFNLAINLADQGNIAPALFHFSEVERLKMDDVEKHNLFGVALAKQGRLEEAVAQFSKGLRRDPKYPKTHYNLAFALSERGQTAEAITSYREALRLEPQWPEALQSLAWLLATNEKTQFRNGTEAVRLAEQACKLTGQQHPGYLDTLAAAYAEAGRLDEAIATAQKALALAQLGKQLDLASRIAGRLQLYQSGKAFRQTT